MKGLRVTVLSALCVLSLAGCRREPSPTVFVDPALAVLVPPDTRMLAGIRMQNLRANPEVDSLVSKSPRLLSFRKDMGLPRDSDVWEYLVASNGANWVVLMRGKFTEMGMEPRLDKPGATRTSHDGIPVFGDEKGAVAFLNPTTAIAGNFTDVLNVLRQRNQTSGVPPALNGLVAEIPSKYPVWFASTGIAPEFVKAEGVRSASGGANLATRHYDLRVDAGTGSERIADAPLPDHLLNWILGN